MFLLYWSAIGFFVFAFIGMGIAMSAAGSGTEPTNLFMIILVVCCGPIIWMLVLVCIYEDKLKKRFKWWF